MVKKIILAIALVLILIISISVFTYQFEINSSSGKSNNTISFTVNKGMSVMQISQSLYAQGLIKSKFFFELYLKLSHKQAKIQAGDYELSPGQSIKALVSSLGNGKVSVLKILTKEGETEKEIGQNLEASGLFPAQDFLAVTGQPMLDYRELKNLALPSLPGWSTKYAFLLDKPKYYSLEGYLFPDTYLISKNSTPEQAVEKMLNNFDQKLTPEMRQEIQRQGKTVYEIVTMASVVEKEVKSATDMKIVAGIFWRRIANQQALQSDATLSYLLNDQNAAHSGNDLNIDSPYNSYKYRGLPPTPIDNPGLNAIIAAIYPTTTDYNFFLTSNLDGQTKYATTFEEHKKNKALYLK